MRACLRRPPGVEERTLPHALSKTRGPGLACARSYAPLHSVAVKSMRLKAALRAVISMIYRSRWEGRYTIK